MKHYTDEDVTQAMHALLNYEPATPRGVIPETKGAATFVLDVVAPAIAARALRELADDLGESLIPVRDGGSSYIDLYARADEIEAQS